MSVPADANSSFGNILYPSSDLFSSQQRYTPTLLTTTILLSTLVLLLTRFLSSRESLPVSSSSQDGARTVPQAPYWVPIIGHLPSMAWDATAFVTGLRQRYNAGAFALMLGGTRHNVIYTPGLATALLGQKPSFADFEGVTNRLMTYVFGFPQSEMGIWKQAMPDLMACYRFVLSEPALGEIVTGTAMAAKANIFSLVTFATSAVDEMIWERTSNVRLTNDASGETVVEASLLPLVRDFCAHTANATIIGSDFLANFPDYFDDLWAMDRGLLFLAAGLPRWLPLLTLTRAHIARKKMLDRLVKFHTALDKYMDGDDPGKGWNNLEDISKLLDARTKEYRKHGLSIQARAASENALIWAANANSNTLIFWMMNRIYADKELLAKVREEMTPFVRVVQPKQELAIPEQPRFAEFDVEGLCSSCPLLKSCYIECLRLDTASWSLKVIKQDFVLQSREKDAQSWLLRKGEYAHAAHDLHNTDPAYFDDPMVWKGDRHLRRTKNEQGVEEITADLGLIRSYGGGSSMCKGRAFAYKECMILAASILAVWDIEPAKGGEWRMPKHVKATGVYTTSDDTRVWLKRRKFPMAGS